MTTGDQLRDRIREAQTTRDLREVAVALGMAVTTTGRMAWCPDHSRGPRKGDASISIRRARDGVVRFHCFNCPARGDVVDLVRWRRSCTQDEALDWLLGPDYRPAPSRPRWAEVETEPEASNEDRASAVAAWLEGLGDDSAVQARDYLRTRQIPAVCVDAARMRVSTVRSSNVALARAVQATSADVVRALRLGHDSHLVPGTLSSSLRGTYLVIPYADAGGRPVHLQFRCIDPDHAPKWRWRHMGGDVPVPWGLSGIQPTTQRVWITEGALKSATLTARGEASIGLPGVAWAAHQDTVARWISLLPPSAELVIGFDVDEPTGQQQRRAGQEATAKLTAILRALGREPLLTAWPKGWAGKDWNDWFATHDELPPLTAAPGAGHPGRKLVKPWSPGNDQAGQNLVRTWSAAGDQEMTSPGPAWSPGNDQESTRITRAPPRPAVPAAPTSPVATLPAPAAVAADPTERPEEDGAGHAPTAEPTRTAPAAPTAPAGHLTSAGPAPGPAGDQDHQGSGPKPGEAPSTAHTRQEGGGWLLDLDAPPGDFLVAAHTVVMPDGVWSVDDAGQEADPVRVRRDVESRGELMLHWPVLVGELLEVGEDRQPEHHVRLWYLSNSGRWMSQVARRDLVVQPRGLAALAAGGLPVTADDAPAAARHIGITLRSKRLTVRRVTRRLGWHGEAFVLPSGPIGASDAPAFEPMRGLSFAGYAARGDLSAWQRAVQAVEVTRFPKAVVALAAALAPALLRHVPDAPNAVVDWSGKTSVGKTTVLRLAASVWGSPKEQEAGSVLHTWQTTRVGVEMLAAAHHHIPLCMDDTSTAKRREDLAQVVYDITEGQGRIRGHRDGGLQDQVTYRTWLLSTGETPLVGATQHGGTRARVMTLHGTPWNADMAPAIRQLNGALMRHHGHAGPAFIRWLAAAKPGWLEEQYQAAVKFFAAWAKSTVGERLSEAWALLAVAALAGAQAEVLPFTGAEALAALEALWPAVLAEGESGADRSRAALEYVVGWSQANAARFYGAHDPERTSPTGGWAGAWRNRKWIGWLPVALDELLKGQGYDPDEVRRQWADAGWIRRDAGHTTWRVRAANDMRWRLVLLDAERAVELGLGELATSAGGMYLPTVDGEDEAEAGASA